jgi:O-antigen/teichoic acid export membrane protein
VYTLAFILTDAFRKQVMGLLTKVLFPAYSSIQKQKGKLKSYYLGVIKINSLVLFPIMTIFIVLAEPIILLGFGDQWQEAVFPLQILSIGVIVHAISGTSTTVMKSLGKADLVMKLNMFITIFITAPFISVGAVFFGIKGVAVGVLLFKILGYAIYQHFIEKVIGVSIIQAMRQLVGLTLCCALIGISIVLLKQYVPMQPALQLVTGLVITGSFYLFYLFRFEKEWIEQVRKIIPSKKIKTAGT